ncbi:hypothetical protein BH10BAC3_BH10BAC3_01150 [soil metagenome]
MLIDASFQPDDFYLDTVRGLCANSTYEFAAWVLNMKNIPNGIRPNITFNIETTTGIVLQTYNTGDVPPEQVPQWRQYGFFFTTTATSSDIVLRMTNKAPGGDGNDLAMDDITFRPCGPKVNAATTGTNPSTVVTLCEGDQKPINFSAIVSAGFNAPAYQWQASNNNGISWNDIPGANTKTYTRLPTTAGIFQYRLTVAESGNITITTCRVASNAITVKVKKPPVIAVSNDGPKCAGAVTMLTASGGLTYTWRGPNGFTASGATIAVNSALATAKYYVSVIDNAGCSNNDSSIIIIYSKPVAKFISSTPACINTSIIFNDQSTVAYGQNIIKWQWDFGDGTIFNAQNTSHVFTATNNNSVTLIVATDKGCADTLNQSTVTHPLPVTLFILPEVCLTDPYATFSDASVIADNSEANFSYLWNFGDASATAGNPNESIQKNPKHTYPSTGNYKVQLTVTSKDGCIKDTIQTFTVNGAFPLANFTIDNNTYCSNNPITITNNSTVNFGTVTKVEIYWDQSNTALKTLDEQPSDGKKYNFQYPIFGTPLTKNVQVKMVAYSGISCVNEVSKTITLQASPDVKFNPIQPVCEGVAPFALTGGFTANTIQGTGIYTGTGVDASGLFDPKLAAPGKHIIRYTYTATNACNSFAEEDIEVLAQPGVSAGPDRTMLERGFITLNATASGSIKSYLWLPNIYLDNNTVLTTKVQARESQLYGLTVTSTDGCSSTDEMLVTVLKTPLVPNVFSPNGDGINDKWIIRYLESYDGVDVQVYDRYGQQVYHNVGYNNPWDGNRNGKPLPVGTYYYIIDRKITATKLTGSVSIIR